jgi:ssDNA-binding Zn-finger/Zn-ribbon topoisomerase 1
MGSPAVRLEDLFRKPESDIGVKDIGLDDEPIGLGLEGERFDLKCPECGAAMQLRPSKHGLFYGCSTFPECKGTHGAHPDGSPLGIPADKVTKRARIQTHRIFDRLWSDHGETPARMTRGDAYEWMRKAMKLSREEAHIGRFDIDKCDRLQALVKKKYPGVQTVWDRLGTIGDDDD